MRMDCAEQIGNYLITSEPTQLSPNLYFFENCENNEGVCFDILTIKETDSNLRKLRRIIVQVSNRVLRKTRRIVV